MRSCTKPLALRRAYVFVLSLLAIVALHDAAFAQDPPATQQIAEDLEVAQLADGVYLHTSWRTIENWGRVPSNGLVVVSGIEALLVDAAWGDTLTSRLLDWVRTALGASVERAVLTHGHEDRMGSIDVLKHAGVVTYALPETAEKATQKNWPRPDSMLATAQHLAVGTRTIETFYPGGGHTTDNIVVWVEDEKLLFGGCMIRPAASSNLGNVADADLDAWPVSVARTRSRYSTARVVIPAHGPVGDRALLDHTLHLLDAHGKEE